MEIIMITKISLNTGTPVLIILLQKFGQADYIHIHWQSYS